VISYEFTHKKRLDPNLLAKRNLFQFFPQEVSLSQAQIWLIVRDFRQLLQDSVKLVLSYR
jgi:hypothetical protein